MNVTRIILISAIGIITMICFSIFLMKGKIPFEGWYIGKDRIANSESVKHIWLLITIIGWILVLWRPVLDAPYFFAKQFPTLKGSITEIEQTRSGDKRITVEGEGKTIRIMIGEQKVKLNEYVTVEYLPHFKMGRIVD